MSKQKKGRKAKQVEGMRRCLTAVFRHYPKYVKGETAAGNSTADNGDSIAERLRGKDLDAVYGIVAKATGESAKALKARYAKLNPGMQRMNLGNKLRGALAQAE
jgi:colicin import membrane protein